jgi:hydantoinase/carbamoylase family amidase
MTEDGVDVDRVLARLEELREIGKTTDGGVTRPAYSEVETEAIEYVRSLLPAAYEVRTDSIGNTFATYAPGADESFYLGSHLDSVYNGGYLDGALGVIAALEAIEAVRTGDEEPVYPPTLSIFRGEESARFGQHTIGSRGALGLLTVEDFSAVDDGGVPLWQAMQEVGLRPSALDEPTIDLDSVAGFAELHIEQGRVLDETDEDVGVVTSIRAPVRYRIEIDGEYDHSGATPMGLREDALAGAAEAITVVERIGREAAADGDLVATVGDVTARDGAINKVCGSVSFPLDVRSTEEAYRDRIEDRILSGVEGALAERDLDVGFDRLDRSSPVELDPGTVETLEDSAAAVDADARRLPSGGGHDAMNFQQVGVPTGMLFTPSVDGVSHNPEEETPPEAIEEATRTMARGILEYGR